MSASQVQKTSTSITALGANADTKSITYYKNGIGDEQSDYTVKYAGTTAVDWTFYFYGASNVRAGTASINNAMSASQVQKTSTSITALGANADTKSITYYKNGIGDEQSDYTVKYA